MRNQWVMRPRAFTILADYAEPDLLAALAEGMSLIAEHVAALETAAQHQTGPHAARAAAAIRVVADDEAGKYLVLLDVARCARQTVDHKKRQLRRCGSHVAKGIYARAVDMRPATYGELIGYVGQLRQSHYLDGPNDVDWIFPNEIEAKREGRLYVDFVKADEGADWISPERFDTLEFDMPSGAVRLVAALHQAGFSTLTGLSIVADVWRDFVPEDDTRWREVASRSQDTLKRMGAAGVLAQATQADQHRIVNTWSYPLHQTAPEKGKEKAEVDENDLRHRQREWALGP
jgi:hypothetical protein